MLSVGVQCQAGCSARSILFLEPVRECGVILVLLLTILRRGLIKLICVCEVMGLGFILWSDFQSRVTCFLVPGPVLEKELLFRKIILFM